MLSQSSCRSFLPIPHKTFLTIPIEDLDPDSLKQSAKIAKKEYCNGNVKHTTIMNQAVKALGFKGGITGYKKEGYIELSNFLRKNYLVRRTDLISTDDNDFRFSLGRREIADRLFLGDNRPHKIFTGYNVNWREYDGLRFSSYRDPDDYLKHYSKSEEDLVNDSEFRKHFLRVTCSNNILGWCHLLDDTLVQPRQSTNILIKLYTPETIKSSDYNTVSEETKRQRTFNKLFRHEIDTIKSGWVDVITFNDNLIFLRGEDGQYDFVFQNLRDSEPPERTFSMGLINDDVPMSFERSSQFPFRYYYMSGQWDSKRRHEAEKYFYRSYGFKEAYPGINEILQDQYQWNRSTPKASSSVKIPANFQEVATPEGNILYVQNKPVTIGEFVSFMNDSDYGYLNRRFSDIECPWEPANRDHQELPACATYYDALAYTRWVENKYGIPLRLLTIKEYKMIHPRLEEGGWAEHRDAEPGIEFNLPDGSVVDVFAHNIPSEKWKHVEAYYTEAYDWQISKEGVQFFVSHDFAEWLFENDGKRNAAAIRTTTLTGVRQENIRNGFHPMASWGKYKHCKIGFRVCFEMGGVVSDHANLQITK